MANVLANLLSGLSLVCGFTSLILSLEKQFTFASLAIISAVIFDGLDGQVARRNPVPSEFGKQLDSLIDVVSFGIAPSILGYVFIYERFHLWAVGALFIYLAASITRLAKYNITPKGEMPNCFIGLPTTASGGILAAFILIYRKKGEMMIPGFIPEILSAEFIPFIFLILVLLLAFLMVSRVRYLNLDGLKELFAGKTKFVILVLMILTALAAYFSKVGLMVFALFLIYLIFSPFVVKRLSNNQ